MINVLQSELMEIEVKLQQALKTSREKFFGFVAKSMEKMRALSEDLFRDMSAEISGAPNTFYEKLKDECEKEKNTLATRIENGEDHDQVLQDYPEEAHEFIVDIIASEDKEMLSDILSQFRDAIDAKMQDIESNITRNLAKDWEVKSTNITTSQHDRNRNIIMEIITTTKKFKSNVGKKFEQWRIEDEND